MKLMRPIFTILLWLNVSESTAAPSNHQMTEHTATQCSFSAFAQEQDPAGLNVRQAPHLSSNILGVLPPAIKSKELDGYKVKIELDILASDHGWFKITNAQDNAELTGQARRSVFAGKGWVSGRQLTVKSQASYGYARPSIKSPYVLSTNDGSSFDNDEMVRAGQLIDCQGQWALVEFAGEKLSAELNQRLVITPASKANLPKKHFRAWVNQICGNQETSCDNLDQQNTD